MRFVKVSELEWGLGLVVIITDTDPLRFQPTAPIRSWSAGIGEQLTNRCPSCPGDFPKFSRKIRPLTRPLDCLSFPPCDECVRVHPFRYGSTEFITGQCIKLISNLSVILKHPAHGTIATLQPTISFQRVLRSRPILQCSSRLDWSVATLQQCLGQRVRSQDP